jgi:uncharacterized protein YcfJ
MRTFLFVMLMLFSFNLFAADARVVATEPLYTPHTEYRQVCSTVTTPSSGVGGAIAGAILGGVVGSRFGGGSGQDAATVVGAVAGSHVGRNMTEGNTITRNQCVSEPFTVQQVSQYKVTVEINGTWFVVYRNFSPAQGSLIPVNIQVN